MGDTWPCESIRFSSDAQCSSDGCDRSRIRKSRDTAWTLQERPISIGWATQTKYVEALEASDFCHDFDRDPNRKAHLRTRGPLWGVRSLDLHRTAGKTRGRNPRSWRDRTAIAGRSSHDCGSFIAESPPRSLNGVHGRIEITINSRSWPDRCAIGVRSWCDRGAIVALLKQNSGSFHANPEATPPPRGITPTTHPIRSHDRVNRARSSG